MYAASTLFQGMSMAKAAEVQSLNVNPVLSSEIQSPLGTWRKKPKTTTAKYLAVGKNVHSMRIQYQRAKAGLSHSNNRAFSQKQKQPPGTTQHTHSASFTVLGHTLTPEVVPFQVKRMSESGLVWVRSGKWP